MIRKLTEIVTTYLRRNSKVKPDPMQQWSEVLECLTNPTPDYKPSTEFKAKIAQIVCVLPDNGTSYVDYTNAQHALAQMLDRPMSVSEQLYFGDQLAQADKGLKFIAQQPWEAARLADERVRKAAKAQYELSQQFIPPVTQEQAQLIYPGQENNTELVGYLGLTFESAVEFSIEPFDGCIMMDETLNGVYTGYIDIFGDRWSSTHYGYVDSVVRSRVQEVVRGEQGIIEFVMRPMLVGSEMFGQEWDDVKDAVTENLSRVPKSYLTAPVKNKLAAAKYAAKNN